MKILRSLFGGLASTMLLAGVTAGQSVGARQGPAKVDSAAQRRTFRVWVFSDAHVASDLAMGRESLAIPLSQSEGPKGFEWDIALNLGDLSGAQGTPKDPEGQEIVKQYSVLTKHRREDIYDISGNHDRNGLDEPQAWGFRKWIDLVFCSEVGKPHSIRNLQRRHFKPILVETGLPDIRLYDLRHTCATLLLLAGENPKVVSERLGHASIVLTLDAYSHVLPSMQQSATYKLEKMLKRR